jgi:hypothetical protein
VVTPAVEKEVAKRDGRLLLTFLLFVASAGSLLVQGWILFIYVHSALNQNWTYFLEVFPSAMRPIPAGAYCIDDCSPDLPLVAAWIGIVSFIVGLFVLAYSWWKPKSHGSL